MTSSVGSSPLPPPPAPVVPSSDIWVGNLLFHRSNRSLKYAADGSLLIMSDAIEWFDVGKRLFVSLDWLLTWTVSIALNFFVLYLSLGKSRQQIHIQKVQFLVGSLAVCNTLLSLGLLVHTLLLDVFYDVDSFDTLLFLTRPPHPKNSLWQFAKFFIQTELVDNILIAQQFILLLASIDRYLTLFKSYSADANPPAVCAIVSTIPFVAAFLPLDVHLLCLWTEHRTANLIRLLSLFCPLLLSLVFSGCALVGHLINRLLLRRFFGPFSVDHLSLSLFCLLCVDAIGKFGIFLQLLSTNLSIQITTDAADENAQPGAIGFYYSLSHCLLMASPLFHAFLSLCCVTFYQKRICGIVRRFIRQRRKPKLNYASETMRSIIADQTRARQMRTGVWENGKVAGKWQEDGRRGRTDI
ncbi:hypothetical protein niasHT_010026 [Heterodera trifolii]|uniref:Uncharacterized protein n=1 Tax=Heterodera trifolii TaxID=157864 RepID=A0ABD2M8G7_9BILA